MWHFKLSWICKTIINDCHCKFASMASRACIGTPERSVPRPPQCREKRTDRREQSAPRPPQQRATTFNLLEPHGRCDDASIGHNGDIMIVCDSGQTRTRTSENKGPCFGLLMRGIRLIQKNYLRWDGTTKTGLCGPEPSINFDFVSPQIAEYNTISNCKSIRTYQTNMCSQWSN